MNLKYSLGVMCLSMCITGCSGIANKAFTPTVPLPTATVIMSPFADAKIGKSIKVTGKLIEIWGMPNTPAPNATAPSDFEPITYYLVDEHENIIVKLKVVDQGKSLVGLNTKIITVTGKFVGSIKSRGQPDLNVIEVEMVEIPATSKAKLSNNT